jgi:multidrug efflux pump subunit AcrA (membrane-fusion protein)
MSQLATLLPSRRPELVVGPLGDRGESVVKDPRAGGYYHLGAHEAFLLESLDGRQTADEVRAAFRERFGEGLSADELADFLETARAQGLLQQQEAAGPAPAALPPTLGPAPFLPMPAACQRLLFWRKKFCDPDQLFGWLEPHVRFFWTRAFLILSAGCIVLAAGLVWACRQQFGVSLMGALRWETALYAWLALAAVTALHESAHGMTCKHHGGEVHEIGFLLLFFMPCFYCNVSDAWLFKEKSKRLWVSFAGGYFELFVWALAVFVWRLTLPRTLPNHLAFMVLSACGVQTLFNFNPLLKLDGYYLLSDWAEVPNLYQRSWDHLRGHARRLLWGAAPPGREPRGHFLLLYGLVGWLYSLAFLALMLVALPRLLGPSWGWLGVVGAVLLGFLSVRGICSGFFAREVRTMLRRRHTRTVVWALGLGGVMAALFLVPIEDRASGPFQVRPAARAELRAAVAGFLRVVQYDEGDRVSPGAVVARLEVPDLASRLAQKQAEVREAQAKLHLLKVGPRHEELTEQRGRVERARAWRDLAEKDLAHARQAHERELARLEEQIAQYSAELAQAKASLNRARQLADSRSGRVISPEEYGEVEKRCQVCWHQVEQARDQKQTRQALGTQEAEAELARREKELADARSALRLLEVGTRPEEVEAERSRLERLQEEERYLDGLQEQVQVASPVGGVVTTPHLKEKVGQYVKEGDLVAVVEEPAALEAEVALAEQDVARVRPGQAVELKARALPFETFRTEVDRVAPAAGKGEVQSTVTVYCRLGEHAAELRPGMTGHARIATGRRSPGLILLDRLLRYLRTEFWW